jgi:predicted double-glycine peptidase
VRRPLEKAPLTIAFMLLELLLTLLLGILAFSWGSRMGRLLLRKGATANNLFKGKTSVSLAFLGLYVGLLVLALYVPQLQVLPLEWRVSGMRITWTLMRIILLGFCGLAFTVSWRTARLQVVAVAMLGFLGVGGFTATEAHFLAPIYASLEDNLQPNGIFQQTSDSSCAPAALATVLRLWGVDATESSVARLAETSLLGTSMPQIIVAAQGFGMDGVELDTSWAQMRQINRPGVIATWLYSDDRGRAPHAIALLGMNNESVIIGDPAYGKIYQIGRAEFLDRYWRNQYVPIFRPADVALTPTQTAELLVRSGVLSQKNPDSAALKAALQKFQTILRVPPTGELDTATALLLGGQFLDHSPRLDWKGTIVPSMSVPKLAK